MKPRIVCAANKDSNGNVVLGIRHYDSFMFDALYGCGSWKSPEEEGFVDQRGNFLTRTEAWKIAEENGQIIRRCGGDTANGGTLYSENLY